MGIFPEAQTPGVRVKQTKRKHVCHPGLSKLTSKDQEYNKDRKMWLRPRVKEAEFRESGFSADSRCLPELRARKNYVNTPATICFRYVWVRGTCVCFCADRQGNCRGAKWQTGRCSGAAPAERVVGVPLVGLRAAHSGSSPAAWTHTSPTCMGSCGWHRAPSGGVGLCAAGAQRLREGTCTETCPGMRAHLECSPQRCTGPRQMFHVVSHELQGSSRTRHIAGRTGPSKSVCAGHGRDP